jgi:membrane protein implicated in regulation of membrane protease activity
MLPWPYRGTWPPPRWVWIAAAVMTAVTIPLMLLGTVGQFIVAIIVLVVLVLIARARLNEGEFRRMRESRPPED